MIFAKFIAGPLDGREQALQSAPYRITFATLTEIRWDQPLDATDFREDLHYKRRGPVVDDQAIYDLEGTW
jgi:hypothetical protein